MPHSKRDVRKYRGSRTHGYGTVGQHRKGGQRGGKGKAGLHKGGWTWTVKYDPKHFGKYGFKRPPRSIPETKILNIRRLGNSMKHICYAIERLPPLSFDWEYRVSE